MTRQEINEAKQKEIIKEQQKDSLKKSIKILIKSIIFLTIGICLFYFYTSYISTVKIEVREYRIKDEKIKESFNGLKIIQMSDLHYGSTMFLDDVKKIVSLINERKPDLVVFTGDLINKNYKLNAKEQENLIKELQKINASLGKYAITGEEDKEQFTTIFNQCDFQILKNESELIFNNNGDSILLVGIDGNSKEQDSLEKAYSYFKEESHDSNIYSITLLHQPDAVDDIIDTYQTDLFLAGHSHNGSIRIPFLNIAPKKDGAKKYHQDYYDLSTAKLYISSGLGTNNKSGIRLFTRPSLNFFRLSQN